MPHVPLFASEKFKGKSKHGLYGDAIEEIDWSTGEILRTLEELGIDERTMVFFTSDNGPWLRKWDETGSALPLRDGKFSTYEGGMREPTIARWPGQIPAGAVCDEVCTTMDLLPTIAKLAGGKVPGDRIIDGKNIWPLMSGRMWAKSPYEAFYYYRGEKLEAIRYGKWKMHLPKRDRIDFRDGTKEYVNRPIQLFDLEADISEENNLAEKYPRIVSKLKGMMERFDAELKANSRPVGKAAD
jgi:arylsulfatase A